MRRPGEDRAESTPVLGVACEIELELVATLVVEAQRPGITMNLEREEVLAAVRVSCRLERADGAAVETQHRQHLVIDIHLPARGARHLTGGGELIRTLGDRTVGNVVAQ